MHGAALLVSIHRHNLNKSTGLPDVPARGAVKTITQGEGVCQDGTRPVPVSRIRAESAPASAPGSVGFSRSKRICPRKGYEKSGPGIPGRVEESKSSAFASHAGEALAAVNGAILAGLEGNLRFLPAIRADSRMHLALRLRGVFAGVAAVLAALRLIHKAFFRIEFLLTGGEHEFRATFLADQSLVFVHGCYLALEKICPATDSDRHL